MPGAHLWGSISNLRAARAEDVAFARGLYFETMRWIVERLFGWDQAREEQNFTRFKIITADGRDVGWIQEQDRGAEIFVGSLYVMPAVRRRGIGSQILQTILARARSQSKAVTLAVVKINPALRFYERHGFRITHDDEYKFDVRADPPCCVTP